VADKKNYGSGYYCVSVGGSAAAHTQKISGGKAAAELAAQNTGLLQQVKSISTVKLDPLKMECGMGIGGALVEWMQAYLKGEDIRKDIQIDACDYSGKSMAIREYVGCQITELSFPGLDAKSKEMAKLSLTFQPELFPKHSKGSGSVMTSNFAKMQKRIAVSNFRCKFGDLPCEQVAKIDAIKCETKGDWDATGNARWPKFVPTSRNIGNIKLTINAQDIEPWEAFHKRFVIDGECSDADEMTGNITYLAQNLKDELFALDFEGVGMINIEHGAGEAAKDAVNQFTVELYAEKLIINKMKLEG
jgi:hypothetical protein